MRITGIVTFTLRNGTEVSGWFNGKNYNGYYYLSREGFKDGRRYAVSEVVSIRRGKPWEGTRAA